MAESRSLYGYESVLTDIADENRVTDAQLSLYITHLESLKETALATKIGRQVDASIRLLLHLRFEEAQRAGVPLGVFTEEESSSRGRTVVSNAELLASAAR